MDEHVFRFVYGAEGGALTRVAAAFTILGGGWVVLALVPLFFVRRYRSFAFSLAVVLVVTAGLVAGLKLVVRRARPCNTLSGVRCLWGDAPTDYSFPSGHAAGSFAFAAFALGVAFLSVETSAQGRSKLLAVLVLLGATFIALSRVYLGVHFPGDVLAGSCLGAGVGLLGARVHLRKERRGGTDAPSPQRSRRSPRTHT